MLIDQTWYQRPEGISEHVSAGGVVARVEGGRILLAFTTERDLKECVLPKGHVDEGETVEQAARREIAEETGLAELTLLADLGVKARLNFDKTSWKVTHYFLFITEQTDGVPTDSHYHDALIWLPLDDLSKLFWPEQRELIEQNRARITSRIQDFQRENHRVNLPRLKTNALSILLACLASLALLAPSSFAQTDEWRKDLAAASEIIAAMDSAAHPLINYIATWHEARGTSENSTLSAAVQAQWALQMAQLNQGYRSLVGFARRYEPMRKLPVKKFQQWSGSASTEGAVQAQLELLLTLLEADRVRYVITDSLQNAAGNSAVVKNRLNEGNRSFGLQYGIFERMTADYYDPQQRQRTRSRYYQLQRLTANIAASSALQQRAKTLLQDHTLNAVASQSDFSILWHNSISAFGATLDPATDLTARTVHNLSQFFGNFVGTNLFRVASVLGIGRSRGHALPAFYKYYPHPGGEEHGVHPALRQAVASRLRAGDLLFEKTRFAITDKLIPGYLGHVAIYLESYAVLQQLGVFSSAEMRQAASGMSADEIENSLANYASELESLHEEEEWMAYAIMRRRMSSKNFNGTPLNPLLFEALYRLKHRNENVIEALRDGQTIAAHEGGVTMNPFEHFLYVDDFVATRLRREDTRENYEKMLARFLALALLQYGKPYDFRFDVNTLDAIVCSELAYQSFVDIKFPTSPSFTGASISPDQVAQAAGIATRLDTLRLAPPFDLVEWFEEARPLFPTSLLESIQARTNTETSLSRGDSLVIRAFMAMVREESGGLKLLSETERREFGALRIQAETARTRHSAALQQTAVPEASPAPALAQSEVGRERRLQNLLIALDQKTARAQASGESQAQIATLKQNASQSYSTSAPPAAEEREAAFSDMFARWQNGAAYRPNYPELYSGGERFFLSVFRSASLHDDDGFGHGIDLQLAGNHEAPRRSELYSQRYAFLPFHLQFFDGEGKVTKHMHGGAALAAIARYYRQGDYVKMQALDWRNDAYATKLSALNMEAGGDKGPLSAVLKLMTIGNGDYHSGLYFGEVGRIEGAPYETRAGKRAFAIANLFYGGRAHLTMGKLRAYSRGAVGVRLGEFGERNKYEVKKDFPEIREWSFGLEIIGSSLYRDNAHRLEFTVREEEARFVQGRIKKDRQMRVSYSWSWDL